MDIVQSETVVSRSSLCQVDGIAALACRSKMCIRDSGYTVIEFLQSVLVVRYVGTYIPGEVACADYITVSTQLDTRCV